jgi:hypothetical protein
VPRYDESKYGVINRTWFGLTKKHGGNAADGYGFGTTDATTQTHLARYYPKGPIDIIKFGAKVLASITAGSQDYTDIITAKLLTRGGSASVAGTFSFDIDGGTIAPHVFASVESLTAQCKAGEYVSIKTGTPLTNDGTAANTATTPGTVAFFMDWTPKYDGNRNWDKEVNT